MRRKILMGVLALALPVGTVLATQTVASAKKPPPNPVTCTGFGGTVTFGTPISKAGTPTAANKALPTSVAAGSFTCSGGVAPNTGGAASNPGLSIAGGKNAKAPKGSTPKYITGSQAEFVASGGSIRKELKTISFTIAGSASLFKTKSSMEVVGTNGCTGEVGFVLGGQIKSGNFSTKTASVTACLGHDSGPGTTNSFGTDVLSPSATIVTAQIDTATSHATL
jgi:hypothetical protein